MSDFDGEGYARWGASLPTLNTRGVRFKVDGHQILGSMGFNQQHEPEGVRIAMGNDTKLYQRRIPRPKQPLTMAPMTTQVEILLKYQQDAIMLRRAARTGTPVLAFFGDWLEDVWLLRNSDPGQTDWNLSRRLAYGGAISHVTHPPRAEIDGVALTIITSGTPSAGEILVPTTQTADIGYETVVTEANPEGSRLALLYWPERLVRFASGAVDDFPAENRWVFSATLEELLSGAY